MSGIHLGRRGVLLVLNFMFTFFFLAESSPRSIFDIYFIYFVSFALLKKKKKKEPLSGSWPWCRAARRRRRGKASGRRDHDGGRFIIWNHDFLRITVICVIYKYSIPNLTFHHEEKVARQASNSPRRDSNYTHLRFPGASTKRIIHDVLPSRVYM